MYNSLWYELDSFVIVVEALIFTLRTADAEIENVHNYRIRFR